MRAPINAEHASHAHETKEHRADKLRLAQLLEGFHFDYVLLEHAHSDVIGVRRHGNEQEIIAGEVERSVRNLLPNVERNCRQGARGTLVVCENFVVMAAIARKLGRSLPLFEGHSVGLTNLMALQLLQPERPSNHFTFGGNDAHS